MERIYKIYSIIMISISICAPRIYSLDINAELASSHLLNERLWQAVYTYDAQAAENALALGAYTELKSNSTLTIRNQAVTVNDSTPLHIAAVDDVIITQILLDYHAHINAKDEQKNTPLHWAAYYDCEPCLNLLLENYAYKEAINDQGYTPLAQAIAKKSACAVKCLLSKGANLLVRLKDKKTLLHLAAEQSDIPTLKHILNYTDQIDIEDTMQSDAHAQEGGITPLYSAFTNKRSAQVQLLVSRGANVNKVNSFRNYSSKNYNTLYNSARSVSKESSTFIHKAIEIKENNSYSTRLLAALLTSSVINYKVVDNKGRTPLQKAKELNNKDAWAMLLQYEEMIRILTNRKREILSTVKASEKNTINLSPKRIRKEYALSLGSLSEDIVQHIIFFFDHSKQADEILYYFIKPLPKRAL